MWRSEAAMPVPESSRKRSPVRPPPPTFSLTALPADAHLTQYEVAQVKRQTLSWTEKCRLDGSDGLTWVYIGNNKPRCLAGSLQKQMVGSPDKGPPILSQVPQRTKAHNRWLENAGHPNDRRKC